MPTGAGEQTRTWAGGEAPRAHAAPSPDAIEGAIGAAVAHLRTLQAEDGSWCAELEGDTILESEWILTMWFLGRHADPRVAKAAEQLRRQQRPEGGWACYPGGPPDVSVSVKAYFALKLAGDDPRDEHLARARRVILDLGGLEACNSYTRIYLAIFGQVPWRRCPAIPPEVILLPDGFPLGIYAMSSWSRAIVVPLSIIWARRPRVVVPEHADLHELRDARRPERTGLLRFKARRTFWTWFFRGTDQALKLLERSPFKPLRRAALRRAEGWVREHLRGSDGVGAIFPPIINTIIGLRALGHGEDDPDVAGQIRELERLEIEEEDTLRVQPCFSALWDSVQVINTLLEAGTPPDDPAVLRAARWVLDHEVRHRGDWSVRLPDVEPGGWYFEYANEHYPDCDDTAEALIALAKVRFPDDAEEARRTAAIGRGLAWLLAMQNEDGGWAAFDRGCDREILTHVPFADHNAMLDPSCEDITGRVVEALTALGHDAGHPAVQRAIAWLDRRREPDGTWFGRWGVNYLYGTWLVTWGLRSIGVAPDDDRLARAAAWVRSRQNPDGGWGELPLSYDDPSTKGQGPSTAAQTAWALITLFAAGDHDGDAVRRGVEHLLATQRPDGSWRDEPWTGTGFPRVFYLRYHLYATYFPLLALAFHRDRRGDPARPHAGAA